jgi:PKD repeat protein
MELSTFLTSYYTTVDPKQTPNVKFIGKNIINMNRTLINYASAHKSGFLILLACSLFSFQKLNAQHCHPGFHFTVNGNTVIFEDQSTADGNITNYNWDFGDGNTSSEQNPTYTYAAPGTYNVCLTITAHNPGCTATFCHHVVIAAPPPGTCQAAFVANQPDPAQPTIDFTDQSTSDGNIGTWEWDFGDGNTSNDQNPSHTYPGPGVYLVCLTITDDDGHCTSHVCHHLVINHPPLHECHAAFSVHQPDPALPTFDFTDQSTSNGTIVSWEWDFGDGNTSIDQHPSHTYTSVGAYLVCLTIVDDGGCTSHVCHQIIVHHTPPGHCHASFDAKQPDPAYPSIHFTDLSTSSGNIDAWEWDFGDGTTSTEQNPTHTYASPGTYLVCLTIYDDDGGCTSHVCHHIVVNHPPASDCHAAFSFEHDASGLGFQFNNSSTGTTIHTTYFWDFGDGTTSTEENPHHTYAHTGIYTVCLFIVDLTTGCTSHICHTITVHHLSPNPLQPTIKSYDPVATQGGESTKEQLNAFSELLIIYPNPVVETFYLTYHLTITSRVTVEIFSLTGTKMMKMDKKEQCAGEYTEMISVRNLIPGIYVMRITADGITVLRQITVEQAY